MREESLGFDVGEAEDDEEFVELEDGEVRPARQSITSGSHNARQRSRGARAEVISSLPERDCEDGSGKYYSPLPRCLR